MRGVAEGDSGPAAHIQKEDKDYKNASVGTTLEQLYDSLYLENLFDFMIGEFESKVW